MMRYLDNFASADMGMNSPWKGTKPGLPGTTMPGQVKATGVNSIVPESLFSGLQAVTSGDQVTGRPVNRTSPQGVQGWTSPSGVNYMPFSKQDIEYMSAKDRGITQTTWGDNSMSDDEYNKKKWSWTRSGADKLVGPGGVVNENNYSIEDSGDGGFFLKVKDGAKEGTQVKYMLQGDQYVPVPESATKVGYGTSIGDTLIRPIAPVALAALGGLGAQYMGLSGFTGGGVAPWEAGLTNAALGGASGAGSSVGGSVLQNMEFGPLSGPGTGSGFGAAELGGLGGGVPGASSVPGMSVMPGTTGAFGAAGAGGPMSVPTGSAAASAAAGMAPSQIGMTGAAAAGGGSQFLDLLNQVRQGAGAVSRFLPNGQQQGGRTNFGSGLAGLIGGGLDAYGSSRMADELKAQAEAMRKAADPYLQRLEQSYADPNSYFNSPEAQAVMGLQTNKLVGQDAATGRLSNSIDRDKALQDFAAARMNDYRSGLRNSIQSIYKPEAVASLYGQALKNESQMFSPLLGAIGRNGTGAGDWMKDITDIIDGGKDIWNWLSDWWD